MHKLTPCTGRGRTCTSRTAARIPGACSRCNLGVTYESASGQPRADGREAEVPGRRAGGVQGVT
eukprot:751577-Hanusia_phi.AAC.4